TNEETKILATVDGKPKTIFESSLRRHLKLNDAEGISSLPDAELFENLALMGYNILPNQKFTFQKDLEISSLKARIKLLEDKDKGSADMSGDDASIKGMGMEIGEEAGVEKSTKRGKEELKMLIDGLDKNNEMIAKHLQEYEQSAADLTI
nr:hypothetical protein [Tanacetum cinerariifolium]